MVDLYIPTYNSAAFLKNLKVDSHFDVTVVDNHSSDGSAEIAHQKGWNVVKRPHTTDRVDNWKHAVEHFIHTNHPWCKWLFAGDELYSDAYTILTQAAATYPQAKLIIAEYAIIDGSRKTHWSMLPHTQIIQPKEAIFLTAQRGNWFGSPIGHTFHHDAVKAGFNFGPWSWAADMQFCYEIAKNHPVLYLKESIGAFHLKERKTYSKLHHSLKASIEEYLLREQAAHDYLSLTHDHPTFEQLLQTIEKETEQNIVRRAAGRSPTYGGLAHLVNGLPFKTLLASIPQRLKTKTLNLIADE